MTFPALFKTNPKNFACINDCCSFCSSDWVKLFVYKELFSKELCFVQSVRSEMLLGSLKGISLIGSLLNALVWFALFLN